MNRRRLLLTQLRGDFAHAGDDEAVEMVIKKLPASLKEQEVLDVGSGFGGTANTLYKLGFKKIRGFDLDKSAVAHAKSHYPHIEFIVGDAENASTLYPESTFSLITLFNVLYAIQDQKKALNELYKIAKPGATLVLFDYMEKDPTFTLKDLAGKKMTPLSPTIIEKWKVTEYVDLTKDYIRWYQELLKELARSEKDLSTQFSEDDLKTVRFTFETLIQNLEQNHLSAGIYFLTKH